MRLVSPADRAVLSGWLNCLTLVRERLLAILEAGGVSPIPSLGQTFDP
jgi:molecular chaperone GrpE